MERQIGHLDPAVLQRVEVGLNRLKPYPGAVELELGVAKASLERGEALLGGQRQAHAQTMSVWMPSSVALRRPYVRDCVVDVTSVVKFTTGPLSCVESWKVVLDSF